MEQGPYEEKILDACRASGEPIPQKIQDKPSLGPGLEFYLSAWQELSYDRPVGFGLGPIPSASLRAYTQDLGMCEDESDRFIFIVREVDNFFVAHSAKKG